MKYLIPNTITIANLLAGCISMIYAINSNLEMASYFILIAAVFDFADGFAARLLNAYTALGKQLDSLADLVSFGVAPAIIMYKLIGFSMYNFPLDTDDLVGLWIYRFFMVVPFLLVIFSALRLAKFNLESEKESDKTVDFSGLPTPANAMLIVGIPFIFMDYKHFALEVFTLPILLSIVIIQCLLMVAPLRMFSLKLKNFAFKDNFLVYIFLIISVVSIVFLGLSALTGLIYLYVLTSVLIMSLKSQ
ncbi:MAG: CDP-alcohol phosphatidyltransferase family protein [Bacteroidales bacterium]|nr:CDP-alcohol phosphatidyltransferase family protein [Bacteroidales bacterium]